MAAKILPSAYDKSFVRSLQTLFMLLLAKGNEFNSSSMKRLARVIEIYYQHCIITTGEPPKDIKTVDLNVNPLFITKTLVKNTVHKPSEDEKQFIKNLGTRLNVYKNVTDRLTKRHTQFISFLLLEHILLGINQSHMATSLSQYWKILMLDEKEYDMNLFLS